MWSLILRGALWVVVQAAAKGAQGYSSREHAQAIADRRNSGGKGETGKKPNVVGTRIKS